MSKNNIVNLKFSTEDIKWENADSALVSIDSNNSFFISKKFIKKAEMGVLIGIIENWKYNLINNYFSVAKNDWVKEKTQKSGIFIINLFNTSRCEGVLSYDIKQHAKEFAKKVSSKENE